MICSAAVIRPFQNILHSEIHVNSKSREIYEELKHNYHIEEKTLTILDLDTLRKKYLKNFKKFDPSSLAGFLGKTLKEEIVFNQGLSLPFKKLIETEDCFICIPVINTCISLLSNLNHDFPHKKHYLNLFSFYVKQGNIYAIVAAHNASFIRSIFNEIAKIPGDCGLSYGQMIYP